MVKLNVISYQSELVLIECLGKERGSIPHVKHGLKLPITYLNT
jgi:hypothetical protein